MRLKAPFPYFGGKSKIARLVWERLGNVENYVEPFCGSCAVLLSRPDEHRWWERVETVNDADCLLANFWRAVQADPDAVARHADWPVNEACLHARHAWLVQVGKGIAERIMGDPEWYDAKIAGWWVWGASCWIGSGWCAGNGPWKSVDGVLVNAGGGGVTRQLPHLGDGGKGVHRKGLLPGATAAGIKRPLPSVSCSSLGVHRKSILLGSGTHSAPDGSPQCDGSNVCERLCDGLRAYMRILADRLRRVRVCCGDWTRVLGESVTTRHGLTGVFLDPPYSHGERDQDCYAVDADVSAAVREWAIANGDNPLLRIALCGYEGEHQMPETWECVAWETNGGYGLHANGRGRENRGRERIWFSPACIKPGPESGIRAGHSLFERADVAGAFAFRQDRETLPATVGDPR